MSHRACALWAAAACLLGGCDRMADQPKRSGYELPRGEPGPATWQEPGGTVARDWSPPPAPPPLTQTLLSRGQQRFGIYCTPCHGQAGYGDGPVVQRGFPAPPSFHIQRLRQIQSQHLYDVITNGYGVMFSYAERVAPADRWAIVAYIRALQFSQDVPVAQLDTAQQAALP